jgi:hypothetical protein
MAQIDPDEEEEDESSDRDMNDLNRISSGFIWAICCCIFWGAPGSREPLGRDGPR